MCDNYKKTCNKRAHKINIYCLSTFKFIVYKIINIVNIYNNIKLINTHKIMYLISFLK